MEGWRHAGVDENWNACEKALDACLKGAEGLRLEAPELDFEALVLVFGDLIAPLGVFEDARRALGRRSRPEA
jgi:hypothetical protein